MKPIYLYVAAALITCVAIACSVLDRAIGPEPNQSYVEVARRLQAEKTDQSQLLDSVISLPFEDQLLILQEGAKLLGVHDSVINAALLEARINHSANERDDEASIAAAWGPCKQDVERDDGALVAQTFAYAYGGDIWCDGDADLDYRYDFALRWALNPDVWRWSATDSWVKYVFWAIYKNRLLACNLCTSPARLILGTNGVDVAGGPVKVRTTLYLVTR